MDKECKVQRQINIIKDLEEQPTQPKINIFVSSFERI